MALPKTFFHRGKIVLALTALLLVVGLNEARSQITAQNRMWSLAIRAADSLNMGDPGRSVHHFQQAVEFVASEEMKTALALSRFLAGDAKRALEDLEELVKEGAAQSSVHYWHGRLLAAASNNARACKSMDRALSLGGDKPVYLVAKAMICRRAGRTAEARKALLDAAARHGNLMDPKLFPDLHAGVLEMVFESFRDFPRKQTAYVTMAHLYFNGGFYCRAESMADEVLKQWGNIHEGLFIKARVAFAAGDAKSALSWAGKALASSPSDGPSLALRGEINMFLGNNDRALADIERSVKLDPKNAVNLARLGHILWERGHFGRAERMFRYALSRSSSSAPAHIGLAKSLDRLKKQEDAERHYKIAISINPMSAEYRQAYALFLQRRGEEKRAKDQVLTAAELSRAQQLFEKRVSQEMKKHSALQKVLRAGTPEKTQQILKKHGVPRSAARFLELHMVAARKPNERSSSSLSMAGSVLSALDPKLLLSPSTPVNLVTYSGKVRRKIEFTYVRRLNFVNPSLLGR